MNTLKPRPWRYGAILAFLCIVVSAASAIAQDYPSKPIRLVVPYPPGGFNDTLARTVGQKLTAKWGQAVVVDNRPGSGSTIGTSIVAKAPPDGYTLLVVSFAFAVNPALYTSLPYDLADFSPIVLAATTPNLLVANPALPIKSVKDLVALAKSKPGKLNYASAGNGSSNHLSMELFRSLTGTDIVHIPYKGSAPAVTDLIGGQVDVMFDNVPNVLQHVKAGKLRALAVSSRERSAFARDVPTVAESGVPGFEVSVWFGIVAPAGTPAAVVAKLNAEVNAILKTPEVRQTFNYQGVQTVGGTPQEFTAFIEAQRVKWAKVVKDSGAKAD
ncbi:MAG TPA: tripartite tricarboxylate transporter substrate binding protein [Burkholderiales bacterium]|nr:tripartite tricarboxylate transporter substrate binding protein [Burkholderiales bacterium]